MFRIRKEKNKDIFDIIDTETKEVIAKETTRKLAKISVENLILLRNRKFGVKSDLDSKQNSELKKKLKQNSNKKLIQIDKVKELKKVQFASDRPTANEVVSQTEPKLVRKKKMEDRIARAKPTLPFESSRDVAPVATPSTETKDQKRQKMLARLERNRPLKILLPADAEAIDKQKKKELKLAEKKLVNELKAKQTVGKFIVKKQKEKKQKEIDAQKEKISQKKAELKASDVNRSQKLAQKELKEIGEDAIQLQLAKKAKVDKVKSDKKLKSDEANAKKEQQREARETARMQKHLALLEAKQRKKIEKELLKEKKAQAKVDLGEIVRKAKLVDQDKKQSQAYLGEIARKQKVKDAKLVQAKLAEIERQNQYLAARSLQEIYLASKSAKSKKEVEKETKRQAKLADIERRDRETKDKFEQARLGAIERKIKVIEQKKKELAELGDIKRANKASETIAKLFKKNAELQGIQRVDKRQTKEEKQVFKHTPFQDMWRNPKTGDEASEAELIALGYKQKSNMDFVLQPKLFEKRAKMTELFEKVPSEVMYTNNKDKVLTPKQFEKLSAKKQKEFTLIPELDLYKSNITGVVLKEKELVDKGYIEKDGNYQLSKLAQRLKASQDKDKPKVTSKTDLVSHVVSQIEIPPESAPIVWNNPVIAPGPLIQPPEPPSPVQIDHYRKYENKMDGTIIYIDSHTNIVYDNHAKAIGVRNDKQKHILNLAKTNLDLNDFNLVKLSDAMD